MTDEGGAYMAYTKFCRTCGKKGRPRYNNASCTMRCAAEFGISASFDGGYCGETGRATNYSILSYLVHAHNNDT